MKYRVKRHPVVQPLDQSIRLIPLTKGQNTAVDSRNYEWLNQWNWCVKTGGTNHSKFYAARTVIKDGVKKTVFMHRVIVGLSDEDPRDVDHHNGDGLDNRQRNLRPCTRPENCANSPRNKKNTSGYKWVSLERNHGRKPWKVIIGGRYVGHYASAHEAHEASKEAATRLYGEFVHS